MTRSQHNKPLLYQPGTQATNLRRNVTTRNLDLGAAINGSTAPNQGLTLPESGNALDIGPSQSGGATGAISRNANRRENAYDCELSHEDLCSTGEATTGLVSNQPTISNTRRVLQPDQPTISSTRRVLQPDQPTISNTRRVLRPPAHNDTQRILKDQRNYAADYDSTTRSVQVVVNNPEPTIERDKTNGTRTTTTVSSQVPSDRARDIIAKYSNSNKRNLRSSLDDYADPETITGKIAEIEDLIRRANLLRLKPGTAAQGMALYEQIVEKNETLSAYIVLNRIESSFRANCIAFTNAAKELREAFSNQPVTRVRSNSVDENQISPAATTRPAFRYASEVVDQLRQTADESDLLSPEYIEEFHGFTSSEALQTMINQLTDRIATHEANNEDQHEIASRSINQLQADVDNLTEILESSKHGWVKLAKQITECKEFAMANVKALRNRVECVEGIPAAREWAALRTEVNQLRALVAKQTQQGTTHALTPHQFQDLKAAVLKDIQASANLNNTTTLASEMTIMKEEIAKTSFQTDSVLIATRKLFTKVQQLQDQTSDISTATQKSTTNPQQTEMNDAVQALPNVDNTQFLHRKLLLILNKISRTTTTQLSPKDDLSIIDAAYAMDKPKLTKLINSANETMKELLRVTKLPEDVVNNCETVMETADNWLQNLEELRHQRPAVPMPTGKPNRKVTIFHGNASLNIYEFLDAFNSAYAGIASTRERADLLYHDFLSETIRTQCLQHSDDFTKLKRWLIEQFGDLTFILNQMIGALETTKPPHINDMSARLSYFTAISRFLFRADRLSRYEGIDERAVEVFIASLTTMHRLINILPDSDELDLINEFRSQAISTSQPHGAAALAIYKKLITAKVEDATRSKSRLEARANIPTQKPKQKTTNTVVSTPPTEQEPVPVALATNPQTPWWTNGLAFPCPIATHDHELGTCTEFFLLTPEARREGSNIGNRRLCWACLRPRMQCKGQCHNAKIPDLLRCSGCAELSKAKGMVPLCVLFCIRSDHDPNKPSPKEVYAALKKYLKSMPPALNPDAVVYANFGAWSLAADLVKPPTSCSKTSPPNPTAQVKVFNTEDGSVLEMEDPAKSTDWGDSCLILQTIKIGKSNCLVMFDRGANINLINGDLAETEGLYVLSQSPTLVQGIGAQGVSSEYGRYLITLGSERGKSHRLTCHGMPQVTVKFPKYDLQSINDEVAQLPCIPANSPLPEFVGGSQVDLLIGNQDYALDPVRIGVLPCGLSVFESPFYDIFGSNICFGGPHPLFAETNRANHFSTFMLAHFVQEVSTYQAQLLANPLLFLPTPDILESHTSSKCMHVPQDQSAKQEAPPNGVLVSSCFSTYTSLKTPPPCIQRKEVVATMAASTHFCSVNKAYLPLSKLREILDEDDLSDTIAYRCPDCSECVTCKRSSRQNAISIQDAAEQLAIEKSVEIDTVNHQVWVDLPFVTDPVSFLSKRHRGSDNYSQALKVYLGQCRKPPHIKEAIRTQHADLVAQGFIMPVTSLSPALQDKIAEAPFRHYFPFRSVIKEDSPSTPVRLVVDPTMTGLNLCLPKGENKIAKIPDVLMDARSESYMWATDIRKMYNQLKIKHSSLQYQLMLYHHSLDPKIPPEVWVLTSAWYGVVNTGNQAGYAVDRLASMFKDKCPLAVSPLMKRRYVDDIASKAKTEDEREKQIQQCQWVLAQGGFSLKYIIRSGEAPPEASTIDGQYVKLLGYKYDPKEDLILPALTIKPASTLTLKGHLSRRIIASRIAELYDPLGLYEPMRLLLKLHQSKLNGIAWDEPLGEDLTNEWITRLDLLNQAANAAIPRAVAPQESTGPLRLLCLSDAAATAGGAAIYAGRKLSNGRMSCSLLTAKSKLMDATVPRNELSAIMLMTDLAFRVKRVLDDEVNEVIYATDSSIALSWCLNTSLKLRLFVFNRVEAVRRLIRWTIDEDNIPLYHIPGELNIADLVTKIYKDQPVDFESINATTPWQCGLPWMTKTTEALPVAELHQINIPQELSPQITEECHSESFISNCLHKVHPPLTSISAMAGLCVFSVSIIAMQSTIPPAPEGRLPFILDIIRLGWCKGRKVLEVLVQGVRKWINQTLKREPPWITTNNKADPQNQVDMVIFQYETRMLKKSLPAAKLSKYIEQNKVLYYPGRLSEDNPFRIQDTDAIPFLDTPDIVAITPVVSARSEIFFAFLMEVHLKIRPHAGNTTTLREIAKTMFVIPFPRHAVNQVRSDCTRCKLIINKTIELEMAKHQFPRTMIAPPFYNSMVDIAFGFPGQPFKNARKKIDIYALVIVCLLTGATNILALEGLETQDVIAALERHSARYGIPSHIFVDNGSQLKALQQAEFSIRDLQLQVRKHMGMKVSVSNAKSHEERGRVERKIRFLRASLASMTESRNLPVQTAMMWETLFAKIANTIDDLPIAKGNSSNRDAWGFEILTANRIKLGRNSNRSLEGSGINIDMSPNIIRLLQRNREIYHTWYQLFMDEIHNINLRPDKWRKSGTLPQEGDVVMFVTNESPILKEKRQWKLGRITSVNNRSLTIQYIVNNKSRKPVTHTLQRNPREVTVIVTLDELYLNSKKYFESINGKQSS